MSLLTSPSVVTKLRIIMSFDNAKDKSNFTTSTTIRCYRGQQQQRMTSEWCDNEWMKSSNSDDEDSLSLLPQLWAIPHKLQGDRPGPASIMPAGFPSAIQYSRLARSLPVFCRRTDSVGDSTKRSADDGAWRADWLSPNEIQTAI